MSNINSKISSSFINTPNYKPAEDEIIGREELIELVETEFDCDEEVASEVVTQVLMQEVQEAIDHLMSTGMIEISGYKDGEPVYVATEKGLADLAQHYEESKEIDTKKKIRRRT